MEAAEQQRRDELAPRLLPHTDTVDTSHVDDELYAQGEGAGILEHEKNFLDPSRWWFASVTFPLLAGTFGPMATAFSICALVEKWRVRAPFQPLNNYGVPIDDPTWLTVLNSLSLGLAIIANAALLLNMSQRMPFSVAQPITVIGFFLASIFLMVMVGIAGTGNWAGEPSATHALTEAYFYACFAAGLYCMISILMAITIYGAIKGHYSKDFQLTNSQRTLMWQTISFMFWLLIGALIFSKTEGWTYLNAFYFADFTLLTIGIGDYYVPKTATGRGLIIPFAVVGIVSLGLVVGSIRSMILEASASKLGARSLEKKREAVLKTVDYEKGTYYIDWYHKRHFDVSPDLSEFQRRRQEFHAMRDIQRRASRNRAWRSLTLSFGAFCVLWFGGAGIFYRTEHNQDWTYFESLYFSYIILLTIGYGDFEARSNSGRPFFVFWSLLAVPALTVLVSDLGDTVVAGIVDLTNWMGSLKLYPGDTGATRTLKDGAQKLAGDKKLDPNDFTVKQPGNFLPKTASGHRHHGLLDGILDTVMSRLGEPDVRSSELAGQYQEEQLRDDRFYKFLLIREIRKILVDTQANADKEYTYEEWAYYLKLLGLDESETKDHCRPMPPIVPDQKPTGAPDQFNLARDIDDDGNVSPWSWLGIRSPLMSGKGEAEWILDRLIIRLQRELHLSNFNQPEKPPPPFSVTMLRRQTNLATMADNETYATNSSSS